MTAPRRCRSGLAGGLALLLLAGCGEGLVSHAPVVAGSGPDAGPADAADVADVADAAPPPVGADGPPNAISVIIPAGMSGMADMGDARLVLQSGAFDQEVTLTLESVVPPPRIGTVTRVFRVRQDPPGAHARLAPRIEVVLDPAAETPIEQLRLALFKDQRSVGLWVAAATQTQDPTARTLSGPIYNLDEGDVLVSVLRACEQHEDCRGLEACSANLCQ